MGAEVNAGRMGLLLVASLTNSQELENWSCFERCLLSKVARSATIGLTLPRSFVGYGYHSVMVLRERPGRYARRDEATEQHHRRGRNSVNFVMSWDTSPLSRLNSWVLRAALLWWKLGVGNGWPGKQQRVTRTRQRRVLGRSHGGGGQRARSARQRARNMGCRVRLTL